MLFRRLHEITLAMGLLVSAETLTILGNSAGRTGYGLTVFIAGAGLIHILTAIAYGRAFTEYPGPSGEGRLIRKAFGPIPAILFPVCARVTTAVCASTGLLATAGYVFNEVFLYWFPNLGFSFCLLALLLIINLLDRRVSLGAQVVFVGVALSGLLFLSVTGLFEWANPPVTAQDEPRGWPHLPESAVAALLLFVGFDLASFTGENRRNPAPAMIAAILLAGIVFSCWAWVSAQYVPLDKLASTSIPYVSTARAILGETGRICMGIVILAGSSAAVNALLIAVSRMMGVMAAEGLLPPFLAIGKNQATAGTLVLAAAVAAMMGLGMAGETILTVYVRAGVFFWLFHYGVVLASAYKTSIKPAPASAARSPVPDRLFFTLVFIPGLVAMISTLAGVLLLEMDWRPIVGTVVILLAIGLAFASFWITYSKKKGWLRNLP
jgi:amino acid transporter